MIHDCGVCFVSANDPLLLRRSSRRFASNSCSGTQLGIWRRRSPCAGSDLSAPLASHLYWTLLSLCEELLQNLMYSLLYLFIILKRC